MPWIESHTVLIRHRKLIELARSLRLSSAHCLGHLHALWHAALEQREDGDLSAWSDEFIAESAGFTGDAPQFVRLLELHGWLDGKLIHDWLDYAGRYLTGRYSSKDKARLEEIWARHGRVYGDKRASERRVKGRGIHSPPLVGMVGMVGVLEKVRGVGEGETKMGAVRAPPDQSTVETLTGFRDTPAGLAQAFCFRQSPRKDDEYKVAEEFTAMLESGGYLFSELAEAVHGRKDKSLFWWQVRRDLDKKKGLTNGPGNNGHGGVVRRNSKVSFTDANMQALLRKTGRAGAEPKTGHQGTADEGAEHRKS